MPLPRCYASQSLTQEKESTPPNKTSCSKLSPSFLRKTLWITKAWVWAFLFAEESWQKVMAQSAFFQRVRTKAQHLSSPWKWSYLTWISKALRQRKTITRLISFSKIWPINRWAILQRTPRMRKVFEKSKTKPTFLPHNSTSTRTKDRIKRKSFIISKFLTQRMIWLTKSRIRNGNPIISRYNRDQSWKIAI